LKVAVQSSNKRRGESSWVYFNIFPFIRLWLDFFFFYIGRGKEIHGGCLWGIIEAIDSKMKRMEKLNTKTWVEENLHKGGYCNKS
jgi:hypothetical protein